jgi:hypothetical protein
MSQTKSGTSISEPQTVKYHCEKPCNTKFPDYLEGEHDFVFIDDDDKEHCSSCYNDNCPGIEPWSVGIYLSKWSRSD